MNTEEAIEQDIRCAVNDVLDKLDDSITSTSENVPFEDIDDEDDEVKIESESIEEEHKILTRSRVKEEENDRNQEESDIDNIVARELSNLSISRTNRGRKAMEKSVFRQSWTVNDLLHQNPGTSKSTDTQIVVKTEVKEDEFVPLRFEATLEHIRKICERIPQSHDDLDDYRLSTALHTIKGLTKVNGELVWKVNAMGNMLQRSNKEIKLLKIALDNISRDLKDEVELLRRTTVTTLRKIIESDISRREQMREQWNEVQVFIRRKNKRINELSDQLNGADIDVGFLLASHKERIEAACVAERNYFVAAEKIEDLELELAEKNRVLSDTKMCSKCITSREETDVERITKQERLSRREEQRKQFEDTERKKYADADRVGQALQSHVKASWTRVAAPAPWHGGNDPAKNPVGDGGPSTSKTPMFKAGYVPNEVFQVCQAKITELEEQVAQQERMNQILSRNVEKQKEVTDEMAKVKKENEVLLAEVERLKNQAQRSAPTVTREIRVIPPRSPDDIALAEEPLDLLPMNPARVTQNRQFSNSPKSNNQRRPPREPKLFKDNRKRTGPPLQPPLRPPVPQPFYLDVNENRPLETSFEDFRHPPRNHSPRMENWNGQRARQQVLPNLPQRSFFAPPPNTHYPPPNPRIPPPSLKPPNPSQRPQRQEAPWRMGNNKQNPRGQSWIHSRR